MVDEGDTGDPAGGGQVRLASDRMPSPVARPAVVGDIPEIIRLVRGMYADIALMYGRPAPVADSVWQVRVDESLRSRMGVDVSAFVIEASPGKLASFAVGRLLETLPSPRRPNDTVGYIEWVGTDAEFRNSGFATIVTEALIAWFREQDASVVDLHASSDAEAMYLRMGFDGEGPRGLSLRLRPVPE